MKFKAAIFDLDGTLLDTIADLTDSMNAALSRLGLPVHTAEFYKTVIGEGLANWALRSLPRSDDSMDTISECVKIAREEYSKRWANKTKPFEGVLDLLNQLEKRGIKLAVLSNKPQDFTMLNVEKFLGENHFSSVVGAIDGIPRKPDPFQALKIAKDIGVEPGDCVFIGDSKIDMQTALAAHMYPVGVLWGFRTKEEIIENGAAVTISHPRELLDVFDF